MLQFDVKTTKEAFNRVFYLPLCAFQGTYALRNFQVVFKLPVQRSLGEEGFMRTEIDDKLTNSNAVRFYILTSLLTAAKSLRPSIKQQQRHLLFILKCTCKLLTGQVLKSHPKTMTNEWVIICLISTTFMSMCMV